VLSAFQTARFCADWLSNGAVLVAAVVFVPIAESWRRRHPQPRPGAARLLRLLIAGLALVVPIAAFPAYWETGTLGQHRTANAAFFAFLLLSFCAIPTWLAARGEPPNALLALGRQWRWPLAALLVAALAFTRNSYALGSDLVSGRLARFDREMRDRYALLDACRRRGAHTCDIDPFAERPASFFVLDVSPEPTDWVNVAYARYFGLAQVRARTADIKDHVRQ
jgi:hypothetical protein